MADSIFGPGAEQFVWATGVENTCVAQARPGQRPLDEFELMAHYEHWKEDLVLCRQLGVRAIRWGAPWYRLEPRQGEFDWTFTDQVIPYIVEELGITPIIDLIHYGCPFWLRREFMNPHYPTAVANFAEAFARRYSQWVHYYTPLNEPVVNALMCGKRGLWPPYLRGDMGYIRIMLHLVSGIVETAARLRNVLPAKLVFVEAAGLSRAAEADLEPLAVEDQHRGYICYDLLTGKVVPSHPLYTWLLRNGVPPKKLEEIESRPVTIDILGMNFYPQWSVKQLYVTRSGRVASRVNGYTWFPMHTMIDWRYRFGTLPAEDYRIELGLFKLNKKTEIPRWAETQLVHRFRSYVDDPMSAVGALVERAEGVMQ